MKTVQELRAEGFKVRVHHIRRYNKQGCLQSKGGETLVEIDSPDGQHYEGRARCNSKESYQKSMGRKIAIGRALYGHRKSDND